ncbi:metallophosphoesterase [Capnocytophaga canimorsus]|uniref:metallophosphoesterase family protein n=1 Tax=Capnocytophaga canimorsus TaxID=28188 RepID=UPI00384C9802
MLFNYKNHKIFAFSDTHGMHHKLEIPENIDILICAGDSIQGFSENEFPHFLRWYASIPAKLQLFVAGNNEIFFDRYPQRAKSIIPKSIILLQNQEMDFEGIRFCSAVARPYLKNEVQISENVDFLITHAPVKGILDDDIGCSNLRRLITESDPKYHIFGHIHQQGLQQWQSEKTTFCNVSYFNHLQNSHTQYLT